MDGLAHRHRGDVVRGGGGESWATQSAHAGSSLSRNDTARALSHLASAVRLLQADFEVFVPGGFVVPGWSSEQGRVVSRLVGARLFAAPEPDDAADATTGAAEGTVAAGSGTAVPSVGGFPWRPWQVTPLPPRCDALACFRVYTYLSLPSVPCALASLPPSAPAELEPAPGTPNAAPDFASQLGKHVTGASRNTAVLLGLVVVVGCLLGFAIVSSFGFEVRPAA